MLSQRLVALPLALLLFGCPSDDPGPPGVLEIGMHDGTDFVPMTDNMSVPVVLGANGLNMLVPSLRAVDVDPEAPEPSVTVNVAGILMAADLKFDSQVNMQDTGGGYVLWDLNVPFQTELCCYNCVEGTITAQLEDRTGRMFEGEVTVVLSRNGTCPDTSVCCGDVNACPDPEITQVCE